MWRLQQCWQLSAMAVLLVCLWRFFLLRNAPSAAYSTVGSDKDASLVRLNPSGQDKRGWLLDPLKAVAEAGLSGGAIECRAVHAGEIRRGGVRANHRHHFCNETFLIWNARAAYRLENPAMQEGFAQAVLEASDVSVCTAAAGQAHAVVNIDQYRTLYLLACQDGVFKAENPMTDFKVWADLFSSS